MVLKISGKSPNLGGRSEAEKSIIPNLFLGLACKGERPEIESATIDRNKVQIITTLNNGMIKPRIKDLPIFHSYQLNDPNKGIFTFNLDSSNTYNYLFQSRGSFHEIIEGVFGSRENSFLIEPDPNLEQVGLESPGDININLKYITPFALWRGLPSSLLENITGFEFNGSFFGISWPKKTSRPGEEIKEELSIYVGHPSMTRRFKYEEEYFGGFKDRLIQTGLVEYKETPIAKDSKRIEPHFIVEPKKIKSYNSLEVFENLTKSFPTELRKEIHEHGKTILNISGAVSRDIFYQLNPAFDERGVCEVYGTVHRNNIEVKSGEYDGGLVKTRLKNATLEDAERFMGTLAFEGCSLILENSRSTGQPYSLLKEIEH